MNHSDMTDLTSRCRVWPSWVGSRLKSGSNGSPVKVPLTSRFFRIDSFHKSESVSVAIT